ncbi:hypothetical protein Cni_G12847 [Canna indica]|uniref:Uncharacterized protein n=1 Tax=Canna indica TaxID=4628 RepID=A0AAQ3QC56_9LILI|nr:hypothetical protein Cni_G12847 [Canna indica]
MITSYISDISYEGFPVSVWNETRPPIQADLPSVEEEKEEQQQQQQQQQREWKEEGDEKKGNDKKTTCSRQSAVVRSPPGGPVRLSTLRAEKRR